MPRTWWVIIFFCSCVWVFMLFYNQILQVIKNETDYFFFQYLKQNTEVDNLQPYAKNLYFQHDVYISSINIYNLSRVVKGSTLFCSIWFWYHSRKDEIFLILCLLIYFDNLRVNYFYDWKRIQSVFLLNTINVNFEVCQKLYFVRMLSSFELSMVSVKFESK